MIRNQPSLDTSCQHRRARALLALLLTGFVVAPALAEKADREKNINFVGDSGGGDQKTKAGELTGNVVITQGTLTIHADRIAFKQNPDNSLSATAYGNPVTFREKRDGADDYYEGYAQKIVYDGSKRQVELFDHALIKKIDGEIRSNYISYNAETEKFDAQGRPDSTPSANGDVSEGSRVRGMFQPQPKDAKDAKPADSKPTDSKAADPKAADPKPGDGKATDAKAAVNPDNASKTSAPLLKSDAALGSSTTNPPKE